LGEPKLTRGQYSQPYGTAAMRPLADSTVSTCLLSGCCRWAVAARYAFRNATHEERLLAYLFQDYEPVARAVMDSNRTVTVSVDFVLLRIHGLVSRRVTPPARHRWRSSGVDRVGKVQRTHECRDSRVSGKTRSSAIAEGPRDASCQLKSCQLPRRNYLYDKS